jgi:hypothetical protein
MSSPFVFYFLSSFVFCVLVDVQYAKCWLCVFLRKALFLCLFFGCTARVEWTLLEQSKMDAEFKKFWQQLHEEYPYKMRDHLIFGALGVLGSVCTIITFFVSPPPGFEPYTIRFLVITICAAILWLLVVREKRERFYRKKYALLQQKNQSLTSENIVMDDTFGSIEYILKHFLDLAKKDVDINSIPVLLSNSLEYMKKSFAERIGSAAGRIRVAVKVLVVPANKEEYAGECTEENKEEFYKGMYVYTLSRDRDTFMEKHYDYDKNRQGKDTVLGNTDFRKILVDRKQYFYDGSLNNSNAYISTSERPFSYESTIVFPIRIVSSANGSDDSIIGFLAIDSEKKDALLENNEHLSLARIYSNILIYPLNYLHENYGEALESLFQNNSNSLPIDVRVHNADTANKTKVHQHIKPENNSRGNSNRKKVGTDTQKRVSVKDITDRSEPDELE